MKVRIIPTILTDGQTVVKGQEFNNWRTVGSAEAIARLYGSRNVDELLFLDVNARIKKSIMNPEMLAKFSGTLGVPFSVGGGINTLEEARVLLRAGAEKIVLGTAAILNPALITEISDVFGKQAVVVALDLGFKPGEVISHSGKQNHRIDPIELALDFQARGAGEILLQSGKLDGQMNGYDLENISIISRNLSIPLIASSGAGTPHDFLLAVQAGASAVAAGAIFQFTENTPTAIRTYLKENNVPVRTI